MAERHTVKFNAKVTYELTCLGELDVDDKHQALDWVNLHGSVLPWDIIKTEVTYDAELQTRRLD